MLAVIGGMYGFFTLVSLFLIFCPPRKVNSNYGYRSGSSGKDQANWDFANRLAPRIMLLISNIALILDLTAVYFLQTKIPVDGLWLITIFGFCFLHILVIPIVELKINRFEENQKTKA
jgi:uncharacterized membrane protein